VAFEYSAVNATPYLMIFLLRGEPGLLIGTIPVGIIKSLGYALLALPIFLSPRALAQPAPAPTEKVWLVLRERQRKPPAHGIPMSAKHFRRIFLTIGLYLLPAGLSPLQILSMSYIDNILTLSRLSHKMGLCPYKNDFIMAAKTDELVSTK
jgi:hypothetical protein